MQRSPLARKSAARIETVRIRAWHINVRTPYLGVGGGIFNMVLAKRNCKIYCPM